MQVQWDLSIVMVTRLELIIIFLVPIILFLHSHKIPLLFSLKYQLFSTQFLITHDLQLLCLANMVQ